MDYIQTTQVYPSRQVANYCFWETDSTMGIWERGKATDPTQDMLDMGRAFGVWFRAAMHSSKMTKADIKRATKPLVETEAGIAHQTLRVYENDCFDESTKTLKRPSEQYIKAIAQVTGADEKEGRAAVGYETGDHKRVPKEIENLSPEALQLFKEFLKAVPDLKKMPKNIIPMSSFETVMIPVLGSVSASIGASIFAEENIRERIPFERDVESGMDEGNSFGVRVVGDCLEGLMIRDGDLLICIKSDTAKNGDIVIVMTEQEEAATKRYRETPERRWLETVPMYPNVPEEAEFNGTPTIVGVYISLCRKSKRYRAS